MNERELARFVRGALDESAERLPYRATHRLAAARDAALAHAEILERPLRTGHEPVRVGHRADAELAGAPPPRLAWRIAAIVLPVALVAVGLFGISLWETQQRADDLADLDAAMFTDDVPIAAYADRGFGVYLRNVSTQAPEQ